MCMWVPPLPKIALTFVPYYPHHVVYYIAGGLEKMVALLVKDNPKF